MASWYYVMFIHNAVVFVCHRTVRIAAVYQLKIKYDQDKLGAVFLDAKSPVSFRIPLEDFLNML